MHGLGSKQLIRAALRWVLFAAPVILICSACATTGGDRAGRQPPERAIEASAQDFTNAFNRGDAKTIAALWTHDGTLVDEQGNTFQGRPAIEKEYAVFFKQFPGARIAVEVSSIEFPARSVAIENGFAKASPKPGEPPSASRYTAVHVLHGGKWLMETVREAPAQMPGDAGVPLKDLQWLIGNWSAQAEGARVQTNLQWVANQHFLKRSYTVERDGKPAMTGVVIIGWDPQAGQIRSWSFDSSGGHGTGFWTPTSEGWRIDQSGTLADGTPTSSRDFVIRVPGETNILGWRSVDRRVGPDSLPDTREVVLDRLPDKR